MILGQQLAVLPNMETHLGGIMVVGMEVFGAAMVMLPTEMHLIGQDLVVTTICMELYT
jgi:hypothetical protein